MDQSIDFVQCFSKTIRAVDDTLAFMTRHVSLSNSGLSRLRPTWNGDLRYCTSIINLAEVLYNHRSITTPVRLSFIVNGHSTNCIWYEVVWRSYLLADRTILEALRSFDLCPLSSVQAPI